MREPIKYRDIFDEAHELTWGWRMVDKRVTGDTPSLMAAPILLSQGIIPYISSMENILEENESR